eukprot:TRINITY_DN5745_c0_g1_i26.p1 TRINITY_DN5745_c0_g1~~TRINITY_DN5745_c0_g1_i26.p1  ORF type:complete len:258 (+),score=79.29 TRINITY_DN5745_c0_g1_i26:128-901(+)
MTEKPNSETKEASEAPEEKKHSAEEIKGQKDFQPKTEATFQQKYPYQMPYGYYSYFYGYSYMGPTPGMVHPDSYYPFPQPLYSPLTPSFRSRTPGRNADYARKYYSHLARVNSPDTTIDYKKARFFVIKSFTEDNVHKSMKYQVWSSTNEGNKRLNDAYHKSVAEKVPLFLFFSVNGSKQFVGVAKMASEVDFKEGFAHWQQDRKWTGKFKVEWIFIKDIPNKEFKPIIVPSNENKSVTNMKDAQDCLLYTSDAADE